MPLGFMWIRFSLSPPRISLLCSSISAMYSIYIAYHYSRDIHSPLMESPLQSFFKTLFYRFSFICISTISPSNHSSYSQEEYASKSAFYRNLILIHILFLLNTQRILYFILIQLHATTQHRLHHDGSNSSNPKELSTKTHRSSITLFSPLAA